MRKKVLGALSALVLTMGVAGLAMADLPPNLEPGYLGELVCYDGAQWKAISWTQWQYQGPCPGGPADDAPAASANSVRGTAFEDLNANGKRDANEPEMGGAWYRVSNGGNWYVCGWVGKDATYSVPVVQPGMTYFVDAIAPVGWKTTTPRVKAVSIDKLGGAYLYNDLGFVRDPSVKTVEGCDQYHPVRR